MFSFLFSSRALTAIPPKADQPDHQCWTWNIHNGIHTLAFSSHYICEGNLSFIDQCRHKSHKSINMRANLWDTTQTHCGQPELQQLLEQTSRQYTRSVLKHLKQVILKRFKWRRAWKSRLPARLVGAMTQTATRNQFLWLKKLDTTDSDADLSAFQHCLKHADKMSCHVGSVFSTVTSQPDDPGL